MSGVGAVLVVQGAIEEPDQGGDRVFMYSVMQGDRLVHAAVCSADEADNLTEVRDAVPSRD